jgi:hypothetical protein
MQHRSLLALGCVLLPGLPASALSLPSAAHGEDEQPEYVQLLRLSPQALLRVLQEAEAAVELSVLLVLRWRLLLAIRLMLLELDEGGGLEAAAAGWWSWREGEADRTLQLLPFAANDRRATAGQGERSLQELTADVDRMMQRHRQSA